MDKPTDKERVEHVLTSIKTIKNFVKGINETQFLKDKVLQSAVQFQFLIIGEAVKNIDSDLLKKHSFPWHIPRSFRNFIIHEYHGVKMEKIFLATQDLLKLEKVMKQILKEEF